MDYSKVAKAKTYFEAVELLRPLIDRFEGVKSLYKIEVKRYQDENVWLDVSFRKNKRERQNEAVLTASLYEDDRHNFYLNYEGKLISGFFSSEEIDRLIDAFLKETADD